MAHIVNRRGYLSLEESYRDENGKPRKRVLAYFGKRKLAFNIFTDVDWAYTLRGDGKSASMEPEVQKPPEAPVVATELLAETVEVKDDAADNDAEDNKEGGGKEPSC